MRKEWHIKIEKKLYPRHDITTSDKRSTYSSTRLTRGTRVSWEANRTLQRDWDSEKTELDSDIWHHVTTALAANSLTEKYDKVMLLLTALIMHKSQLCLSLVLTYRVTLGTVISRGSAATGGSSSSRWAAFSLLSSLSFWALGKNASQTCQHEDHIRAIHATLTIAC